MTEIEELQAFADKYFPESAGKVISVGLLRAYLSENHFHYNEIENGRPMVLSMKLDEWVRRNEQPIE